MKPRSVMAPYSAVAAARRSGFTRLGTAASDAGLNRPVPAPASRASPTVAAKLSTSATPRNAAARTTSETIRQLRRDQRSAAAPNTGPSSMAGTRSARRTRLIAHAELKRS
jgi:hypothetical protein